MQVANLPGYSLKDLKAFVSGNGITTTGNRTMKQTCIDAIDTWHEFSQESIALAVDAEKGSTAIAEKIEIAVVSIGSLVVAALISEAAIGVYRGILKGIVLTVVLAWMLTIAAVKWLWNHKHHAAVWHWVSDWLDSPNGRSVLTHALIFEWVLNEWLDAIGQWSGSLRDRALVRIGFGGVAIEVQ